MLVIVILGSPSDAAIGQRIVDELERFGVPSETRIGSAHKTPSHVLDMLSSYEADPQPKVYITVAGRSNALSGFVDGQVTAPVIACPPYSDRFGGADIFSSLRMPSGVAPAVVLEPEGAALLAAKILALTEPEVARRVDAAREQHRQRVLDADGPAEA